MVFLSWCFCGGAVVFLWWCFCFLSGVDFRSITEKFCREC